MKGALLFALWGDQPHRPTRDLDLLGFGAEDADRIRQVFAALCALPVEETDGLDFRSDTLRVSPIREAQAYGGLRVVMQCLLGETRMRVQVDIGFGDVVTPAAVYADFPSLIGLTAPHARVYPRETVVAEKFEALVRLGAINSRMKDFYDLWALAHEYAFDGPDLAAAVRATFTRRGTPLPASTPRALANAFAEDPETRQLWSAFVTRSQVEPVATTLAETVAFLVTFLIPVAQAIRTGSTFDQQWQLGGSWQPRT